MILNSMSHLQNCFCIKSEGGIGTAFTYKHNQQTFFVTASHVLGNTATDGYIYFKTPTAWRKFKILDVIYHPEGYDAATFIVAGLNPVVDYLFSHHDDPNISLGAELKFTGFPHGLENTAASEFGYSTPLVKTAFFSGIVKDQSSGKSLLILDGLNNPGYSGGPVWVSAADGLRISLFGLISGYRIEERGKSLVYRKVDNDLEEKFQGLYVKPNSGMIHAVSYKDLMTLVMKSVDKYK